LVFAEAIGPASGYVLAYEPQKLVSYMLCGNIALNNLHNVYSFNQAVGLESGHIDVPLLSYETDNNFGGVSLKDKNWEENVMCYQVKMITIDSLNLQHCHFIKIDVEGMEIEVLKGAKETINRCKPFLYIEDDREDRSQELYDFIKELDYKSFAHHPPLFNPKNWAKNKDNVFGTVRSLNRFCAHKSVDVTI
jgi:FkbM family methyltransferase